MTSRKRGFGAQDSEPLPPRPLARSQPTPACETPDCLIKPCTTLYSSASTSFCNLRRSLSQRQRRNLSRNSRRRFSGMFLRTPFLIPHIHLDLHPLTLSPCLHVTIPDLPQPLLQLPQQIHPTPWPLPTTRTRYPITKMLLPCNPLLVPLLPLPHRAFSHQSSSHCPFFFLHYMTPSLC
ncbi:unnamed protein product [Closterium sp. NIES-54]